MEAPPVKPPRPPPPAFERLHTTKPHTRERVHIRTHVYAYPPTRVSMQAGPGAKEGGEGKKALQPRTAANDSSAQMRQSSSRKWSNSVRNEQTHRDGGRTPGLDTCIQRAARQAVSNCVTSITSQLQCKQNFLQHPDSNPQSTVTPVNMRLPYLRKSLAHSCRVLLLPLNDVLRGLKEAAAAAFIDNVCFQAHLQVGTSKTSSWSRGRTDIKTMH